MTFLAVDLCCGAGGWACAGRGLPIEWLAVADRDPYALETWRINHAPDHPGCRIIQCDLSTEEGVNQVLSACLGAKVDVVVGGIPCEQVSCARGKSKESEDGMASWHALIDACISIVKYKGPEFWAFEDVIQVEKHLPLPLAVGIDWDIRRFEARDYGPQDRLRTFFGAFPDPIPDPAEARTLASCLLPGPHMTELGHERFERVRGPGRNAARVGNDKMRIIDPGKPSPTVMGHLSNGSRQRRSFTIEDDRGRVRRLCWREAALLQGFPTDYLFVGGLNKTEKLVGQAIPIQIGRSIFRAMTGEGGGP